MLESLTPSTTNFEMQDRFARVASWFWPALLEMPSNRQALGVGEVIPFLFFAPLSFLGITWLVSLTSLTTIRSNLPLLLFIGAFAVLLGQLKYFILTRIQSTRFGRSEGSLAGVIVVSGFFLIGPVVFWIPVLITGVSLLLHRDRAVGAATRWRLLRQGAMDLSGATIAPLIALEFYSTWGGMIPISGLGAHAFLLALAALAVDFIGQLLLGSAYLGYHAWIQGGATILRSLYSFVLLTLAVPYLASPFGVLAAGIYVESGLPAFLFFCTGLLLVAVLARRWSVATETSRQQSDALVELEGLGHDIITSMPDEDRLPRLLAEHLPNMFPSGNLILWRLPDQVLFRQPQDWRVDLDRIWPWLAGQSDSSYFLPGEQLPWDEDHQHENPILITPVLEHSQPIGAIYLSLHQLLPWDRASVERLVPATQSLAALIASAFSQSQAYANDIRLDRVSQELQLAGEIQSSLIPFEIPSVPGWRISVTLNPAQETSGDFFDLIPLPDGKLGVVIADVVDKGVGAALYMALSRTLLRTYAIEADSDPELVFFATNARMLADTTSNLFVTAFYGVLDPESGQLTYSNAGHNPPYVVRPGEQVIIQELIRTGIPIGIQEGSTWNKAFVQLQPGDRLLLYTDGIPDAHNGLGDYLTTGPMLEIAKENLDLSAEDLQLKILQGISDFVGDTPQSDDITLMILARDRLS
ncbi:MAG: SpoIIE family protein phosphatase [Anaerolineales bacterium]